MKNVKYKKIKVLHVLGCLNMGGAETVVMNFYQHIDKEKFHFDFIVHQKEKGDYDDLIKKLGGNIYYIPNYKVHNHFEYKKAWKIFFEKHPDYDIIHGHVRSTASIYLKIAKKFGIVTISHSHSISNGKGISNIIKNILQFKIRYVADYFMGCSYEANKWLFGKKVANSNSCYIINNAIDYQKFYFNNEYRKEIRKKYDINENILLGHVGRLIDVKNHKFLIKLLSIIIKENKNYRLMLCGDGPLKEEILKYAEELDVSEYVYFVSATQEIYKYYSAFDIFLFPSLYEGLGMVGIEAQISGLPIIVSKKVPKAIDITNKVKFLDIKEEDINKWVNCIYEIEPKRLDIKVKNDYNIRVQVKQLEKIYQNFLNVERECSHEK